MSTGYLRGVADQPDDGNAPGFDGRLRSSTSAERNASRRVVDAAVLSEEWLSHGFAGQIYHHSKDDQAFWDVVDDCAQSAYAAPETLAAIAKLTKQAKAKKLKGKELRLATKGPAYENGDVSDSTYTDGVIADNAIEQLRQKDDRPFFLAVGFKKPHLPLVAPEKYWDMYDPTAIEIPSRESPVGAAEQATTTWGELRAYTGIPAEGDLSSEQTRSVIHAYRACVSYVDAQIELYDHSQSDLATENVAELPENVNTVKQLDELLLENVSP